MKVKNAARRNEMLAALAASTILSGALVAPALGETKTTPIKHIIKHVVVLFNENESFDHYFATYPVALNPEGEPVFNAAADTPTVNGLTAGLLTNNPNLKQPFRLDRTEAFTCDMDHGYTDEQKAYDGGLVDLFVQAVSDAGFGCRPDRSSVMGYYDGNTVTAIWNLAQRFSINDNMFDTMFGPSTPGAINLVSGQTGFAEFLTFRGGSLTTTTQTTITGDTDPALDDCGSDKGGTANGTTLQSNSTNIGDLLNEKGISWGWFAGGFKPTTPAVLNADGSTKTPAVCGSSHTFPLTTPNPPAQDNNPTGIDIHTTPIPDYVAHHQSFMYYASTRNPHHLRPSPDTPAEIGKSDQANHQYDASDFFNALAAGNLPAVSFIKPPAFEDAHPANSDPLDEQTFLVTVLNALQRSPEWSSTLFILTYDDSDGWYDHVMPPIINPSVSTADSLVPFNPAQPVKGVTPTDAVGAGQIATSGTCATPGLTAAQANELNTRCGHGPRLVFLLASPFAKKNFVDHTLIDQTSVIRFIETNFGLDFIDGPDALDPGQPLGQGSFDHLSGSIENMLDFDNRDESILLLNPTTGEKM
jgi:phospholipase C